MILMGGGERHSQFWAVQDYLESHPKKSTQYVENNMYVWHLQLSQTLVEYMIIIIYNLCFIQYHYI